MKILVLAGLTMVTAFGASAADAQRIGGYGAPYPVPGQQIGVARMPPVGNASTLPQGYPPRGYPARSDPQQPSYPRSGPNASRWGASVSGRWAGGTYAPGGWNAYRRPSRGYRVPSYWLSPDFYIGDYGAYGLALPPQGYNWYRYYDDAVLLDGRGKVWDSRGGLDWEGAGYGAGYGYEAGEGGYAASGYGHAEGGAGAAGGYGMQQPPYPSLPPVSQNGAVTTYQTGYSGYGGGTTTVVTIQPTETITTTTTEYVEESTARYAAPRRVYRAPKRQYRPVVRRSCGCQRVVEQPIQGS